MLTNNKVSWTHSRVEGQGRILQADFTLNNKHLTITNIYAPAYDNERKSFFRNFPQLQAHEWHLLVGDLNMYPKEALDHSPPAAGNTTKTQSWDLFMDK